MDIIKLCNDINFTIILILIIIILQKKNFPKFIQKSNKKYMNKIDTRKQKKHHGTIVY